MTIQSDIKIILDCSGKKNYSTSIIGYVTTKCSKFWSAMQNFSAAQWLFRWYWAVILPPGEYFF